MDLFKIRTCFCCCVSYSSAMFFDSERCCRNPQAYARECVARHVNCIPLPKKIFLLLFCLQIYETAVASWLKKSLFIGELPLGSIFCVIHHALNTRSIVLNKAGVVLLLRRQGRLPPHRNAHKGLQTSLLPGLQPSTAIEASVYVDSKINLVFLYTSLTSQTSVLTSLCTTS